MKKYPLSRQKGFTLAELLIVVAIIAVLVAIAIPIFRKNLEKSREAYDIYTMRQAASAAIELYYAGVTNSASASAVGLSWWGTEGNANANAYGAYDPSGKFYPSRDALPANAKKYGKGTTLDGGTTFVMGNSRGAYASNYDYTNAVVMVSIYPNAAKPYVLVYWKNNVSGDTTYVGGQQSTSIPKYSIQININ
ncbi:MAG: prepilin-type N-terminal cleavage/methylation domain-containing protein [Lachnospiraceae bacterium]|nr:prepilin-type N-terminal cleavage/methylation domain-containing protein [Lachnospiraceae bacterium]